MEASRKGDYAPLEMVGPYQVVRLLGRGAAGTVYEARNPQIGKRVALKVLDVHMVQSKEMVLRFQNEARAASRIEHPGIVNVFDFNQLPDGTVYLVMEFISGEPLAALIRRMAGPVPGALRYARQIALALKAAHERGIVHRDLKPANVMMVADPEDPEVLRSKVVDFGIAKLGATEEGPVVTTRSDAVMGTPAYMAPEQCRGAGTVTDKADVYSLGVILYELLSGTRPFKAQTQVEMMYHQMKSVPEPLEQRCPALPAPLYQLVQAMLAKEPAARPPMALVAQALAVLEEGGMLPLPGPNPSPAQLKRGILLLVLLLLAMGGMLLWGTPKAPPYGVPAARLPPAIPAPPPAPATPAQATPPPLAPTPPPAAAAKPHAKGERKAAPRRPAPKDKDKDEIEIVPLKL